MYSLYEYNQAGHMKVVKEEGIAVGEERGIKKATALFAWLKMNNRQDDILQAVDNPDYLNKLFEEYSKAESNPEHGRSLRW